MVYTGGMIYGVPGVLRDCRLFLDDNGEYSRREAHHHERRNPATPGICDLFTTLIEG